MRKILTLLIVALVLCAQGLNIKGLEDGMSRDHAQQILNNPLLVSEAAVCWAIADSSSVIMSLNVSFHFVEYTP